MELGRIVESDKRIDMARAHMVFLSKLALLGWRLNAEIDRGAVLSFEDVESAIREARAVRFIKERLGQRFDSSLILDLELLEDEDDVTVSECFARYLATLNREGFGIQKNGLAWMLALTIEMVAKQEWTTYD